MTRVDRPLVAVATISAAVAITSFQDVSIKWISGDYPFHQMQTIRCLAAMPIVLLALIWSEPLRALRQERWAFILLRGGVFAIASVCFYVTAVSMAFPEAVAIYFTMPLFVAALAGFVLGERVPTYRWVAVVVGFTGIVVMLRPGSEVFNPAALLGLLCALLYALGNMMTRPLGPGIPTSVLAVYQNAMYAAVAGSIALVFGWGGLEVSGHPSLAYVSRPWVWPSLLDTLFIMAIGASTGLLMVLFTRAYRLAESSFVAPFEYTAILWAVLASYLILGELPDRMAFAGIGLVVGAGLFMVLMDRYTVARRPSERDKRGTESPRQLDLADPVARPLRPGGELHAAADHARIEGRR